MSSLEFLYHGSSVFTDLLLPNQAYDGLSGVVALEPVKPLKVDEIEVSDYLYLVEEAAEEARHALLATFNQEQRG